MEKNSQMVSPKMAAIFDFRAPHQGTYNFKSASSNTVLLLFESLHDSRPMLGAGSSSGVELFQVFMGTRLWHDGADQQVFHGLFIPTFAHCLSILVESPFLHKGFASSNPCPEAIYA